MQTRATTSLTIAALRNLLRGDPSALDRTAPAAQSFRILALRPTTAMPQTVPTSQQRDVLSRELIALSASEDQRISSVANLIRAAMQSYRLAVRYQDGTSTRQRLETKAQKELAQAQVELDAIELAEQAGGARGTDRSQRPLPQIPSSAQSGILRQAATPQAAQIPRIPTTLLEDPTTGRIQAAMMQPLRQRMAGIALPPVPPNGDERDNVESAVGELLRAVSAGDALSAKDLTEPSELMMSLSYLISYDLAALCIDDNNPGEVLYNLPHLVINSPSGINSNLSPLKMAALLLKTLRELANTANGSVYLGPLVAQLNSVIQQPIPGLTLIDSQVANGQTAQTTSVTLDALLRSVLSMAADETKIYEDFENLVDVMERALNSNSQPADRDAVRDYLKFYLVNDSDARLDAAIETAAASVLTQLRYVIECFVQGFYAMDPVLAAAIFPNFAVWHPPQPAPTRPARPAPPPPSAQPSMATAALCRPLSAWQNTWPAASTAHIESALGSINGALSANQPEAAFANIQGQARNTLLLGMEQILRTAIDPIGMTNDPLELKALFFDDQRATPGAPFVVPAGQPRVMTQLNSILLAAQQIAQAEGLAEISGEIDDILGAPIVNRWLFINNAVRGTLRFSQILQDPGRGGEFSQYVEDFYGADDAEIQQGNEKFKRHVTNAVIVIARARAVIQALLDKLLRNVAINLPAKISWPQDEDPNAGGAASAIANPRPSTARRPSLAFPAQGTVPPQAAGTSNPTTTPQAAGTPSQQPLGGTSASGLSGRRTSRTHSISTPDLTAPPQTARGTLPDVSQAPISLRGRFRDFFRMKKSRSEPEITRAKLTKDMISSPIFAPKEVIVPGAVAWDYPDYRGAPVTSHASSVLEGLRNDIPHIPGDLTSADPEERREAVASYLVYQKNQIRIPEAELVPHDPSKQRFKDVRPMRCTQIDSRTGEAIGVNQMVINNKVVGLACSFPLDDQLGEMYSFMFDHNIQGLHVVMQDADLQKNNCTNYFDPVITPISGAGNSTYRTNATSHRIEIDTAGIASSTHGGKILVEKVAEQIYDQGQQSATKLIDLKLTRGAKTHYVRVLHSNNWVDKQEVSPDSLEKFLTLREECFRTFSPDRVLTHCHAGVGRTGTLLAAEAMRHMPNSSLFEIVTSLRDSRSFKMVQSNEQLDLLLATAEKNHYPFIK